MFSIPRLLAAVCAALLIAAARMSVRAEEFSAAQRGDIERIVHDYLVAIRKCCRRR